MKKKPSALSIFLLCFGVLEVLINGYDIIGGGAPAKTWVMLVWGLFLLALGLFLIFGKTRPSTLTPKEEYMIWVGACIGWGGCTFLSWIDRDCVFDSQIILNLVALAFFIIWTFIKKERIPKD